MGKNSPLTQTARQNSIKTRRLRKLRTCSSPRLRRTKEPTERHISTPQSIVDNHDSKSTIYMPLDNTPESGVATRLVRILPDLSPDGKIQCHLFSVLLDLKSKLHPGPDEGEGVRQALARRYFNLETNKTKWPYMKYNALSYLWGEEQDLKSILINGTNHTVRPNLWGFLDRARSIPVCCKCWWWIDALCIDQSNTAEKNHQVKSMGLIYSHAYVVVSWLGEDMTAWDSFLDVAHDTGTDKGICANYRNDRESDSEPLFVDICRRHSWTVSNWRSAYYRFIKLEYWNRAWVMQEVRLADQNFLLTSSRFVSFRGIALADNIALHMLKEVPGRHEDDLYANQWLQMALMYIARDRTVSMYGFRPIAIFYYARNAHCSNHKDRIYSQLSLVQDGHKFHVDYAEDDYSLFLRTVLFCYSTEEGDLHTFWNLEELSNCLSVIPWSPDNNVVDDSNSKAQKSELLLEIQANFILFEQEIYDRPVLKTRSKRGAANICCPKCGANFTSVFDLPWSQFTCFTYEGMARHISFMGRGASESGPSNLQFHFEGAEHWISQKNPVETTDHKICLNLSTCLWLTFCFSLYE